MTDTEVATMKKELTGLEDELRTLQGDPPLTHVCVQPQTIAEVVSAWTGIPVGKMMADEIKTVLHLRERAMEERIIGQSHALELIARAFAPRGPTWSIHAADRRAHARRP